MNPSRVARNVAFGSVPPVIWFQASCLAAGSGNAARQAAACRAPASVASLASSASTSPGRPRRGWPAGTAAASAARCRRRGPRPSRSRPAARRAGPGRRGAGHPGKRLGGGELAIRPWLGPAQQVPQGPGDLVEPGATPGRVGEPAHSARGLAQHGLQDRDVLDRVNAGQGQAHVVARGHLCVPAHVPRGGPAQRGRQRVGEVADAVDERAQGMGVQADLGVGQVVVVDQDQVGPPLPDQLRHLRALAVDVDLDPVPPGQPPRSPRSYRPIAMRCGRSTGWLGWRLLEHGELGEPGRRRPLVSPAAACSPRRSPATSSTTTPGRGRRPARARRAGRRAWRCPRRAGRSSGARPARKFSRPDVGDELLEHRGALGVGDAVEVDLDGLDVGDVGGDRVRGRQLILPVGPGLPASGRRSSRPSGPAGGLGLATSAAQVANDSFSHRSSHQRMVTRSPNHMCAISCRIVSARGLAAASVTRERKT